MCPAKTLLTSLMGGKSCFGESTFQPQALHTPAFQGGGVAFPRVRARVFQRQSCGLKKKKKKVMFNLKIRNWSRL